MLRPRIKECYDVIPEAVDRYQIRSSEETTVMKGATVQQVFSHLLPLLDGRNTEDTITEKLASVASAALVHAVIEKLRAAGVVEEAATDPANGDSQGLSAEELAAYRHQLVFLDLTLERGSAVQAQLLLKKARLSIVGSGELAAALAREAIRAGVGRILGANLQPGNSISQIGPLVSSLVSFEAIGVETGDQQDLENLLDAESPTLLAIAIDRGEPVLLEAINKFSQSRNVALLHCVANGTQAIVGPLVVPGQTACLTCYRLRVNSHVEFYEEQRAFEAWVKSNGHRRATPGTPPALANMAAAMAALEIIKHVTEVYEPEIYDRFISIDALTLEVISHQLLKLPRCPDCGGGRSSIRYSSWQEPR
ncbi:MAG: hypothetical protein DMF61_23155 [Blastocatellia bacterium AA13]|nr:MAG: hypothetical protein DMF61_23155 [Blastocatellia bacterium AA13]